HHAEEVVKLLLVTRPVLHGAQVVADVRVAGGLNARKHALLHAAPPVLKWGNKKPPSAWDESSRGATLIPNRTAIRLAPVTVEGRVGFPLQTRRPIGRGLVAALAACMRLSRTRPPGHFSGSTSFAQGSR